MTESGGGPIVVAGWSALTASLPGFREFCRTLTLADGSHRGTNYNPDLHPAQACIADAIEAGASWVTIAKPVQDGGSLIAFALMLWRVCSRSQTAIMAYPTLTAGRDAWTKKLQPMLAAIDRLPKKGGGSGGGAASVINIPGGGSVIIRSAGGRHESGQASSTGDVLIPDEVDDWPDLRRVKLIEQRISKSPDPLQVYISTVKRDGEGREGSHILRLWESGSKTRLEYPCPYCGTFAPLIWENVDRKTATITCTAPGCGVLLTESERLAMLPKWRRVDGRNSDQFSILWTALDSPFPIVVNGRRMPVMRGLVDEYAAAEDHATNGDHAFMRQFHRDRLCRPYIDNDSDVPATIDMVLAARAATNAFPRGVIPPDATVTTVGADTGKKEAWFLSLAMAPDLRWWVVDWSVRECATKRGPEPTPDQQRDMLDAMRERAMRMGRADAMGVDVGYNSDMVAKWAKSAGLKLVRGDYRGIGGKKEPASLRSLPSWADERRQDDGNLWLFLDGGAIKAEIHKALARPVGTPGSGQIPIGQAASDWLIRHITSEVYDAKKQVWAKRRPDNHLLDCLVYAWALAMIEIAKRARLAAAPPPPPPTPGGNWVTDY